MSPPIYAIGEKKPDKKFRASTGFEPVTSANTGALRTWAHSEDRAIACFSPSCKIISFILSSISFMEKIEPTKMTWLPMCGFIAQLVEHRTGIRGGHGFETR